MNRMIRIVAMLLCLTLLFGSLPQAVLANEAGAEFVTEEPPLWGEPAESEAPEAVVLGEMTELRTESSKTFRMSDGSHVLAEYGQPIHYAADDGQWAEYDNTLQPSDVEDADDFAGVENQNSPIRVKFANNAKSNNLVKIATGDYKIRLHLIGADTSKAADVYAPCEAPEGTGLEAAAELTRYTSGVIYREILSGTDLEYLLVGGLVKENIRIKERQSSYAYPFELKLQGLTPVLTEPGEVELQDEQTGETIFRIPAGYLYDANGATSNAVSYSLSHQNGKKYTLTVTADAEWINAPERVFPVTLDPTLQTGAYLTDEVSDSFVYEGTPAQNNGTYQFVLSGYASASSSKLMRAYFKLNALPELPASSVIVHATLNLRQLATQNNWKDYTGTADCIVFAARQVTGSWTGNSICWNNKPAVDPVVLDYQTITAATANQSFQWNITRAVQSWYDGSAGNHGIAIYPVTEYNGSGSYAYAGFYSIENPNIYTTTAPMFTISYRDTKGLEGLWSYSDHGAGEAGRGYVNLFNGNLVLVHDDLSMPGNILPITVSHVFNTATAGSECDPTMPVGKGWQLSVQETVRTQVIGGTTWYVYHDSDGTDLYFYNFGGGSVYKSEDGYGLTIEKNSAGEYLLRDEYGNTKRFSSAGTLLEISDVIGNRQTFSYTNGRLTKITRMPAGSSTTNSGSLLLSYNSSGALYRITNGRDSSDYVEFSYSTTYNGTYSTSGSGYLRQIATSGGRSCVYHYNANGTLSYTHDSSNGYRVRYQYQTANSAVQTKTYRVSEVKNDAQSSSAYGEAVRYIYADKKTTVRTWGKDEIIGNSDDILTTYCFDHDGRTICSYRTDVSGYVIYGSANAAYNTVENGSKKKNTITKDNVVGLRAMNLIPNSGFETDGFWSYYVSDAYCFTAGRKSGLSYLGQYCCELEAAGNTRGYASCTGSVYIPSPGTYTYSAYVAVKWNEGPVSGQENSGFYLSLDGQKSEIIKRATVNQNFSEQNAWERISVTKEFASPGTYTVELNLYHATGRVYIDHVQLEQGTVPSSVNLLANGGMDQTSGWSSAPNATDSERGSVMKVIGSSSTYNYKWQTVQLNIPKHTTLTLSGWGKACSAQTGVDSTNHNRVFRVVANILYTDGTREDQAANFNPDYTGWQFSSAAIVPKKDVQSITVYLSYDFNVNEAYFDDVGLSIEPAQTYAYDENGNLIELTDPTGNQSLSSYAPNGVDLASYTNAVGEQYQYTYKTVGGVETHWLQTLKKTDAQNRTQTLTLEYDAYGNVKSGIVSNSATSETIQTGAQYTDAGNYLSSSTDNRGNTTDFSYDEARGLLAYVQDVNGEQFRYTYDGSKRVCSVYWDQNQNGIVDGLENVVFYSYDKDRLSSLSTDLTRYSFEYDAFGNRTTVQAGDYTLATYDYGPRNGKLVSTTYGNGLTVQNVYDALDRVVAVQHGGTTRYTFAYNGDGQLAEAKDIRRDVTYTYAYDSLGRLVRSAQKKTSTGASLLRVENGFDSYGRPSKTYYTVGDRVLEYTLSYQTKSNLVKQFKLDGAYTLQYGYDVFERLTSVTNGPLVHQYAYLEGTTLPKQVEIRSNTPPADYPFVCTYEYDSCNRITKIAYDFYEDDMRQDRYEYDSLGQLIREDNGASHKTYLWEYDQAGNIQKKYTLPYTTVATNQLSLASASVVEYTYGDASWGDLLTNYNGTAISYDAIGNPQNWKSELSMSLSWSGRNLTGWVYDSMVNGSYSYNADGIRTYKSYYNDYTANSFQVEYILDGTRILHETYTCPALGNRTMDYYYDASGDVIGFEYKGSKYYYGKTAQGDVVRIYDESGQEVVAYAYDAWGAVLSVKGTLAGTVGEINPFRYRSYYYDVETGFY